MKKCFKAFKRDEEQRLATWMVIALIAVVIALIAVVIYKLTHKNNDELDDEWNLDDESTTYIYTSDDDSDDK